MVVIIGSAWVDTADSAASRSEDARLGRGITTGTVVIMVGRSSSAADASDSSTAEAAETTRESIGVTEAAIAAFSRSLSVLDESCEREQWLTRCQSHRNAPLRVRHDDFRGQGGDGHHDGGDGWKNNVGGKGHRCREPDGRNIAVDGDGNFIAPLIRNDFLHRQRNGFCDDGNLVCWRGDDDGPRDDFLR